MLYRTLTKTLRRALKTFPAVVVTGPRQSGKTTLLKSLLKSTHGYVNLEDPDTRIRAKEDPRGFLNQFSSKVIIDEIQYVPELLPYIKSKIDDRRRPGQWILTGSQNFTLMRGVSESLAGRVAVLSLLPFSCAERIKNGEQTLDSRGLLKLISGEREIIKSKLKISTLVLRGNYPEIASRHAVDKDIWCGSYISTYLERDVRNLSQVGDLAQFERFLRLCATRTGRILNISELAREIGISVPTAKRWLSMLETGYQVFLLYPYYRNIGKRLIKSPKLYFTDTALVCYLLGLKDEKTLINSPHFPHIFETMVVIDFWKRYLHFGELPSMFFMKTRDGLEVDLVLEMDLKLHLFEIKSSSTIVPRHATSLINSQKDLVTLIKSAAIISTSMDSFSVNKIVKNYSWQDVLMR